MRQNCIDVFAKKITKPGQFFRLGVCVLSTHIAEAICMLIFHKAKSATGN
jgi:hypothetical protein